MIAFVDRISLCAGSSVQRALGRFFGIGSALVLEGKSRGEAATSCGMDRQILCDWVHRYNSKGLKGLHYRTSPGAKPKLAIQGHEPAIENFMLKCQRKLPKSYLVVNFLSVRDPAPPHGPVRAFDLGRKCRSIA
jgi:hypothetical protein